MIQFIVILLMKFSNSIRYACFLLWPLSRVLSLQPSAVQEPSMVLTVICPGGQNLCCCRYCELMTNTKIQKESACHFLYLCLLS